MVRRRESCFAIRRFDNFKIGAREQIPQELSVVLLILDDQDALAHAWPVCASTRTGTVK